MTNTEKFVLKEDGAKETVTAILKLFDGKSYKFANAALNAAKSYLVEDSHFDLKNALKNISSLELAKKN